MSNELAIRTNESTSNTPAPMSWGEIQSVGQVFFQSGLFKDLQNQAQAVVKVLAGREYGMEPFSALQNIHIIQNKPTLAANAMAMAVKKSGKYDYRVLEMSDKACEIEFFQAAQSIGRSRFDLDDAKRAGTQNLQKFARNMLFARAISNGVRWYAPDVFSTAVYTPEEMGAVVDGDGAIINVPQEQIPTIEDTSELQAKYETLRAQAATKGVKNAKGEDFVASASNWTTTHYTRGIELVESRIAAASNKPKANPQTLNDAVHAKGEAAKHQTPEDEAETERVFGDADAIEGEVDEYMQAPEMMSEAQRGALFAIAAKLYGQDAKDKINEMAGKSVTEITKAEATGFIDNLKQLQEESKAVPA